MKNFLLSRIGFILMIFGLYLTYPPGLFNLAPGLLKEASALNAYRYGSRVISTSVFIFYTLSTLIIQKKIKKSSYMAISLKLIWILCASGVIIYYLFEFFIRKKERHLGLYYPVGTYCLPGGAQCEA